LENYYFCYASFSNILGVLWVAAVVYIVPFMILLLIYVFITKYLRKRRNNLGLLIQLSQNRDFIVIRRVLLIVCLLLVLGIPAMGMIAYVLVVGEEHPLAIRIGFLPVSISVSSLSVSLMVMIPQLKTMIEKFYRATQVINSVHAASHQNGVYVTTVV